MQLVQLLQLHQIPLQGRVLIKIIQHIAIQSLEGNVSFHLFHCKNSPPTQFPPFFFPFAQYCTSYLHEDFDVLVFSQEVFAEGRPLRHQVQELLFPLQRLLLILFPPVSLGAIGGVRLRFQHKKKITFHF